MRIAPVLTALTVVAASVVASPSAAQAASGVQCGETLHADAHLTHDLTCAYDQGIVLDGHVTLDLRGHRLRGDGDPRGTAIKVTDVADVVVRNGRIEHWGTGLSGSRDLDNPGTGTVSVSGIAFSRNQTGLDFSDIIGTYLPAPRYVVARSSFTHNTTALSAVAGFASVTAATLSDNGAGVRVITGSLRVSHSTVTRSQTAFSCDESFCSLRYNTLRGNVVGVTAAVFGADLTGNTVTGSDVAFVTFGAFGGSTLTGNHLVRNRIGVSVGEFSTVTLRKNVIERNTTGYTADADDPSTDHRSALLDRNLFLRNGDGLVTSNDRTSLRKNVAIDNTHRGIYAPHATDLGGNIAFGNGTSPQCVGVAC
ncbi:right-handed parallel beta-helix repeat-containing protein [Angustibacter luteus]|uniref:Right-handed parallel beta-helix repeat-containing protein n=1 Tax=Angustibacter luteus TaxID=658456 RepID=A0ABW1JH39_9ACTN